ncbi:Hsp70 family protein [Dactylosporangium darangshiense]|uniref:Hsp70 family protein n=1 Tax=Dactylosporangium darangshiense TaxID=579108 RepID=UPI003629D116
MFIGDHPMPVPRLFAHVLSQVNAEARRQLGAAPEEVRLTHPARWGERRRSLLIEATRISGLGTPRLIAEPVGAASYFTAVLGSAVPVGRSLAIYDLGGGTFDATVVRRTQSGFEVLAEDGLPDVGGLDFDHAIIEHLGKTYSESHPQKWASLANPTDASDRRLRRMLYEDVRGAKEMLSRTASTDIHIPSMEIDAHLTREELETLVRPYLERTVACLRRAIESARLQPKDLVGIFLVGGSSRIPLAAHLIHTELGVAPTTLEQPETVVVEGALCIGAAVTPGGTSGTPRQVTPAPQPARPVAPVQPQPARPVQAAQHAPVSAAPMSGVPVSPAVQRPPVQQPVVQPRPPVVQQPVQRPVPPQPQPVFRAQPAPQPVVQPCRAAAGAAGPPRPVPAAGGPAGAGAAGRGDRAQLDRRDRGGPRAGGGAVRDPALHGAQLSFCQSQKRRRYLVRVPAPLCFAARYCLGLVLVTALVWCSLLPWFGARYCGSQKVARLLVAGSSEPSSRLHGSAPDGTSTPA